MSEFVEVVKIAERMCNYYDHCKRCPVSQHNNSKGRNCQRFKSDYPEEYERICIEWAEEHPVKTNADKFKEVFGFEPSTSICMRGFKCTECEEIERKNCSRYWWNKEYKAPTEEVSE